MRRAALSLSVVMGVLLAMPPAASGGGWWSSPHFPSRYLVSGETAVAEATGLFATVEAAEDAGRFYAYLIPDLDWRIVDRAMNSYPPGRWWRKPEGAVLVGRVEVLQRDSNLVKSRVTFEVPDLPPGRYAFMLCDFGCIRPMGDTIPVEMKLVDSPQALSLSQRIDHVSARLAAETRRVERKLEASIFEAGSASAPEYKVEYLRDRVSALERAIEQIPTTRPDPSPTWPLALGWGLAGAASGAALVLARRRRIEVLVPVREEASERAPSATSMR